MSMGNESEFPCCFAKTTGTVLRPLAAPRVASSRTTRAARLNGPQSAPAVNASSAKPMLSSQKIANFDKNIQNISEISHFEAEKNTIRIFTFGTARAPQSLRTTTRAIPGTLGYSKRLLDSCGTIGDSALLSPSSASPPTACALLNVQEQRQDCAFTFFFFFFFFFFKVAGITKKKSCACTL